ncbi:MAG TPA: hypothetical protein VM101_12630 [Flavitalea sp.]|nr:hypothetical protein [Flavitalea sp.]
MGKDREGQFHPGKGKPSGANKEEGLGLRPTFNPDDLERDGEITERYTTGPDTLADDVRIRHRNRNTSKGEPVKTESQSNKSWKQANKEEFTKTQPEELIGIIPKELFTYLSTYRSGICVSILIPTHDAGVQVNEQEDQLLFKNSLQQAEKILLQRNTDQLTVKKILHPGYELLKDEEVWRDMKNGLAVYMAENFMKFLRLPGEVNDEILVNSSFSVMQLVPFMVRTEYFYILDISKKNCRFFRADAFGIEHIPVDELPTAVDDVVHFENKDDQKLFRLSNNGSKDASYHGMGAGKPDEKQHIALYLEEVDDTLWDTHLHLSNAPLLLAGLDFLIPIYKSVSDYKFIWPEALTGNHQQEDATTLYGRAMKIMQPYFDQPLRNALQEYGNKSATNLTSSNNNEIIPAAFYGRISQLFVQKDAHIWGTFREDTSELKLTGGQKENAENLADRAVAKTIETGGSVFILDKAQMPGTNVLAAIFRY